MALEINYKKLGLACLILLASLEAKANPCAASSQLGQYYPEGGTVGQGCEEILKDFREEKGKVSASIEMANSAGAEGVRAIAKIPVDQQKMTQQVNAVGNKHAADSNDNKTRTYRGGSGRLRDLREKRVQKNIEQLERFLQQTETNLRNQSDPLLIQALSTNAQLISEAIREHRAIARELEETETNWSTEGTRTEDLANRFRSTATESTNHADNTESLSTKDKLQTAQAATGLANSLNQAGGGGSNGGGDNGRGSLGGGSNPIFTQGETALTAANANDPKGLLAKMNGSELLTVDSKENPALEALNEKRKTKKAGSDLAFADPAAPGKKIDSSLKDSIKARLGAKGAGSGTSNGSEKTDSSGASRAPASTDEAKEEDSSANDAGNINDSDLASATGSAIPGSPLGLAGSETDKAISDIMSGMENMLGLSSSQGQENGLSSSEAVALKEEALSPEAKALRAKQAASILKQDTAPLFNRIRDTLTKRLKTGMISGPYSK